MTVVLTSESLTPSMRARVELVAIEAALRGENIHSSLPLFRGITDDGRALFAFSMDEKPSTLALFTLNQVSNFIRNSPAVSEMMGHEFAKAAVREFRNARWALTMGFAKPNMPLTELARRAAAKPAPSA
ncbi:MAG: hypothetical protein WAO98_06725 [Alphaproteobacteria bacterium]